MRRSGSREIERDLGHGEVRGDESTESRCREPDIGVRFARRPGIPWDSTSLCRFHGRVTYTEQKIFRCDDLDQKSLNGPESLNFEEE